MEPAGVHHVSINVDDVDAALDFYVNLLGFTVRGDRPDFGFGGAWLNVGPPEAGQQVHLIQAPTPPNQGQHFAVRVADLPAVVEELRAAGVTVSDPRPVATNLQSFLSDPAGNGLELHQVNALAST